jgi:hydrogenase/urease accessory protein HupE
MKTTSSIFAILVVLVLGASSAHAHQSSFSYASIELASDARSARYEVRLGTGDLFEALALGENRDASNAEIAMGADMLSAYVFERVQLKADQSGCSFVPEGVKIVAQGQRFAQVAGSLRCPRAIVGLELDYRLFFDLDPRHEGLLRSDGELVQLSESASHYRYETGHVQSTSVAGFLRSGAEHVLYGLDHILFLVALLLVVCLRQGEGMRLHARSMKESLRKTGGIVTAFTIGHSLTLIVASMGWFTLPGRFVESMIAASIVFVAVENVLRPDPKRRYLITFAFGLMHGLGFAAMLQPLLPPGAALVPLLVFNIGVEIGQLAIVALCLPVLVATMRILSAGTYRRYVLSTGCAALTLLGIVWFLERALEIKLIGI